MPESLPFLGEQFQVAEQVGLMPVLRFAKAAKSGLDSDNLDGLAAIYDLIEQCLDPAEWQRFEKHCDVQRAGAEDMLAFVAKVVELVSNRPTERPSNSSDGPTTTSENSTDDSSTRVIRRLESMGRPDLAVIAIQAAEAS